MAARSTSFLFRDRPIFVCPDGGSAFAVRASLCRADGAVAERVRLCWPSSPAAAVVVASLARLAVRARRRGYRVRIDEPSEDLVLLLEITGLGPPDGPIAVHFG